MQQVHVLVDLENNQPTLDDVRRMVPDVTDVWLFHSAAQKKHLASYAPLGDRRTPVPITRKGSNALDFHLTFYLGYLAAKNPGAKLVVLAIDKGYSPMVEHARSLLNFEVAQLAFRSRGKESAPAAQKQAKPPVAKKAAVAKKTAAKKVAGTSAATKVAATTTEVTAPKAKKAVAKKTTNVAGASAKKAASTPTTVKQVAKSPQAPSAKAPAAPPAKKAAKKAAGKVDPGASAVASAAKGAKKKVGKSAAATAVANASPPSEAAPATASQSLAPSLTAQASATASPAAADMKRARTLTLAEVVKNLRKMGQQRPKKLKQLERHLSSLLITGPADPAVGSLLANLLAADVVRGGDGSLSYGPAVTGESA